MGMQVGQCRVRVPMPASKISTRKHPRDLQLQSHPNPQIKLLTLKWGQKEVTHTVLRKAEKNPAGETLTPTFTRQ